MKRCDKCYVLKDESEFAKDKYSKDGLTHSCKECRNAECRNIYKRYKNKNVNRDVQEVGKSKICSKCKKIKPLSEFHKSIGKIDGLHSQCNKCNIIRTIGYHKKYRERYNETQRLWRNGNIRNKVSSYISKSISYSLLLNRNGTHWEDLVGYNISEFIKHIESQFQNNMSWSNYGRNGWHIDHIIPISLWEFESYTDREFKQCWALANLQPMWGSENKRKGNRLIYKIGDRYND